MPFKYTVKITTVDAELEFSIQKSTTGKDLFDQVVKTIGLREIWYFGLQYVDNKGKIAWLRPNKKVMAQDVKKENPMHFNFLVKFFPEDVSEELIQDITQRMFFGQLKQDILSDTLYCPAETAVLLASYACQVKYEDYEEEKEKDLVNENLIPKRVMDQYKITTKEWVTRVALCWKDHEDLMKEDAMMEYLKITQDLDMYGVNYFDIRNKKGTDLLMGVDSLGINIYEKEDKLTPRIGFPWSEIRNISFDDKKFIIKPIDKKAPDFIFFTEHLRTNKRILALCMGNHEMYMRRRKSDSIEIQQMKKQGAEEKAARDAGKAKIKEEKRRRLEEEEKLRVQEERHREMEEQLQRQQEEMRRKEEEYEKLQIQRQEELQSKNYEIERLVEEKDRTLVQLQETEKEKENLANSKFNEERERIGYEKERQAERLRIQLEENKRELEAVEEKRRALEILRARKQAELDNECSVDLISSSSSQDRSEESEFQPEKNLTREQQLSSLKDDLDAHKDENKTSSLDIIYAENMRQGKDKYKTLKQIKQGNTKQRIDEFEGL